MSGGAHDETFAEQCAAWVLGALPPDEAEAFARHLETCEECRREVALMQTGADTLVDAVEPAAAPPSLERRLMEVVSADARRGDARAPEARPGLVPSSPPRPATRRRPRARLALAAVASVALLGIGFAVGWAVTSDGGDAVSERRLPVRETEAVATLRERAGVAELVLEEFGPPPRGQVYQLWLRRPGRPLAATNRLFSVSDEGTAVVALPRLDGVEELVVTAEPPQGSRSPTLPPVLSAGSVQG